MGMAGGAYKGDMERARLALQARQVANQSRAQAQAAALRQRELDQRQQMIDAARQREADARDLASMHGKAGRKWLGGGGGRENQAPVAPTSVDALAARVRQNPRAENALTQKMAQQQQVFSGYAQLGQRERAQREQRQAQGASAVASVLKLAGMQGKDGNQRGVVPLYALQALNRDMGFDGQNQGFVQGGYTSNGDFFLTYARRDPQSGQLLTKDHVLNPIDQYKIMHQQPGIFNDEDRGNQAGVLKKMGYRDNEILLASGLDQTGLERMQKLMAAQKQKAENATSLKDSISGLTTLQSYLLDHKAELSDEEIGRFNEAIAAGMKNLTEHFLPKKDQPGVNGPQLSEDGATLKLPNGVTLQKDQEYTNPQDGKKYIWRGGDAKNFEAVGTEQPQTRKPGEVRQPGEGNQTMTDSEFSARRAHQAQFMGKVQPGYELEGDDLGAGNSQPNNHPANQEPGAAVKQPAPTPGGGMAAGAAGVAEEDAAVPKQGIPNGDENVDLDALISELEAPAHSKQGSVAATVTPSANTVEVQQQNNGGQDGEEEPVVVFPEDEANEKAWNKWWIENGRSDMDKEQARERFFKRLEEDRLEREERERIIGEGPAPEDPTLPRVH